MYERSSTGNRSGIERPVTRWRREDSLSQVITDHSSIETTSTQKLERPISRRGLKTDLTDFGMSRPPTSGKVIGTLSRPPSPSLSTISRVSSARIAPQTGSAVNSGRINSALTRNYGQPNAVIIDRPITQQGLVGVRPGSSRVMLNKQIQDKMYYKQLLQMKIQELNQEITSIAGQVGGKNVETNKYHYNEDMEKSLIIDDDDEENDYDTETINVEREAKNLKEIDDTLSIVAKKQIYVKKKYDDLTKEVNFKRKIAERFAGSMDTETKAKYNETFEMQIELQKEIDRLQEEHDKLSKRRSLLMEKIALLPMKQEIYNLYNELIEIERKQKKNVNYEDNDYLENEDENVDVDLAEKQIMEIEKKIADAQLELDKLDDEDDKLLDQQHSNNRPKTAKVKTEQLLEKINDLEEQIANRLERISNVINVDDVKDRQLNDQDLELFVELSSLQIDKINKSYEELKKDYLKLYEKSSKLEALESKIDNDGKKNNDSSSRVVDVFEINDEDDNNDFVTEKYTRNNDELIENIKKNEIYRFISILNDKLLKYDSKDVIVEGKMEELIDLIAQYNTVLINNFKLIY